MTRLERENKDGFSANLIAGLIPRVQGVTDPEMAQALAERDIAMQQRALTLAAQAIEARAAWVQRLGPAPGTPGPRARWLRELSTVAAYRDCWHITEQRSIGAKSDVGSTEQMGQRQRALAAAARAVAISHDVHGEHARLGWEPQIEVERGVEL
jgi:hypothetical protein